MQDNSASMVTSATFRCTKANEVWETHALLRRGFEKYLNNFSPLALNLTPRCIRSSLSNWRVGTFNRKLIGCAIAFKQKHLLKPW